MCTRDSVVLAGGDDVFQPLTSGNYERSLYAARMRSHDVDRVATFKRVDSSPSAASRSARRCGFGRCDVAALGSRWYRLA